MCGLRLFSLLWSPGRLWALQPHSSLVEWGQPWQDVTAPNVLWIHTILRLKYCESAARLELWHSILANKALIAALHTTHLRWNAKEAIYYEKLSISDQNILGKLKEIGWKNFWIYQTTTKKKLNKTLSRNNKKKILTLYPEGLDSWMVNVFQEILTFGLNFVPAP